MTGAVGWFKDELIPKGMKCSFSKALLLCSVEFTSESRGSRAFPKFIFNFMRRVVACEEANSFFSFLRKLINLFRIIFPRSAN